MVAPSLLSWKKRRKKRFPFEISDGGKGRFFNDDYSIPARKKKLGLRNGKVRFLFDDREKTCQIGKGGKGCPKWNVRAVFNDTVKTCQIDCFCQISIYLPTKGSAKIVFLKNVGKKKLAAIGKSKLA